MPIGFAFWGRRLPLKAREGLPTVRGRNWRPGAKAIGKTRRFAIATMPF